MRSRWVVSVVSHGHGASVSRVLSDIHAQLAPVPHRLVLTLNRSEDERFLAALPTGVREHLSVRRNPRPLGFGANHNAALRDAQADHVLVADPDLSLPLPVFGALETALAVPDCGIVAPLARTPDGRAEDNARRLPSPRDVLTRRLRGRDRDRLDHAQGTHDVDWVAGLLMAMRADTFAALGGFDERYHLYCEDVDLCLRSWRAGLRVQLLADVGVTHPARRDTHRKPRHFIWHLRSLLRLWSSRVYREHRRIA
ncbi:MAG: glycosyltransferase [Sinimarinibacterium flocculans]|uniref:glycosyltransferase n=1 Tax=Sinimarinibacterium flocculans TaxID=985250 RepID=UPI003C4479B5